MAAVHVGFSPFLSIHSLTVKWVIPANVYMSLCFSTWTTSDAPILHPTSFAASRIWDQQKGVCQLWYFAGLSWCFFFWPCGFLCLFLIFVFNACAGCVNSAMFPLAFLDAQSLRSISIIYNMNMYQWACISNYISCTHLLLSSSWALHSSLYFRLFFMCSLLLFPLHADSLQSSFFLQLIDLSIKFVVLMLVTYEFLLLCPVSTHVCFGTLLEKLQ